jgi:hypothetical protein
MEPAALSMDLATPEMLISRKWNYCCKALATTHAHLSPITEVLEDPPLMIDETTLQSSPCKEKP